MSHDIELVELAERVVAFAEKHGADEVGCAVSEGSHVTIQRRGGKLVTKRFARTRGHDGQRRAARHNSANHLFLHPAKGGEAEDVMQKRGNVARHRAALAAGGGKG